MKTGERFSSPFGAFSLPAAALIHPNISALSFFLSFLPSFPPSGWLAGAESEQQQQQGRVSSSSLADMDFALVSSLGGCRSVCAHGCMRVRVTHPSHLLHHQSCSLSIIISSCRLLLLTFITFTVFPLHPFLCSLTSKK